MNTTDMPWAVERTTTMIRFDGYRVLDADGVPLAELAADERWYTPEGIPCTGLSLAVPRVRPEVSTKDAMTARQAADEAWMASVLKTITRLAETQPRLTSDDLWAALDMPPRESRMIGNALAQARAAGLLEPTGEHRPSTRTQNHLRPVRVWRSLRYGQQHLC